MIAGDVARRRTPWRRTRAARRPTGTGRRAWRTSSPAAPATTPAMRNDSQTAAPATSPAAPRSAKIPAPTIAPTPMNAAWRTVRCCVAALCMASPLARVDRGTLRGHRYGGTGRAGSVSGCAAPGRRGCRAAARRRPGRTAPSRPRSCWPVLREYQMNRIEKTSDTTATTMSRTNRGVSQRPVVDQRHLIWASAENPYGMAAVMPVISTSVVKTVAPLEPEVVDDHRDRGQHGRGDDAERRHAVARDPLEPLGEQAVLGGGERHLGADHRPAVERAEAGDDDDDRHHVAGPGAAEHRVGRVGERRASTRPAATSGRMPNTAVSDSM